MTRVASMVVTTKSFGTGNLLLRQSEEAIAHVRARGCLLLTESAVRCVVRARSRHVDEVASYDGVCKRPATWRDDAAGL